jgi:hypothetical protein
MDFYRVRESEIPPNAETDACLNLPASPWPSTAASATSAPPKGSLPIVPADISTESGTSGQVEGNNATVAREAFVGSIASGSAHISYFKPALMAVVIFCCIASFAT